MVFVPEGDIDSGSTGPSPAPNKSFVSEDEIDPSGKSYGKAVATGVIESLPYSRQATAAGLTAVKNYVAPAVEAVARPINRLLGVDQDALDKQWQAASDALPSSYGEANKRLFQAGQEAEKEHPWLKTGTSLATGAALMPIGGATGALESGITRAVPSAAKVAPLLSNMGVGSALGAGYGASGGEGLFDPWGAAKGAGYGAVGGTLPWVAGKMARGVGQFAGLYNPGEEATAQVAKAFQRDAGTGNAAMTPQEFATAKAQGAPVMVGDLGGEAVRRLSRTAVNQSPEAGAELAQPLGERFQQQGSRMRGYVDSLFPGKNLNTAIERDQITTAARAQNTPAYQAAFSAPNAQAVWSQRLQNLMGADEVQSAVGLAQKKANAEAALTGNAPVKNPFVQDANGIWRQRVGPGGQTATPSLQWWDYVKRGLDSQIGTAQRQGDNDSVRVMSALKDHLVSELDAQVPQYAQARAGAAKFFGQENAVDGAQEFDKATGEGPINQAISEVQAMSSADREVFARAYGAQLKQKMAKPTDTVDLARQFSSDELRGKMAAGLNTASDPMRAQKMEALVHRENMMNMLKQKVLGNSSTWQQKLDAGGAGGEQGLLGSIIGHLGPVGGGAVLGAGTAWHESPEDATWGERAKRAAVGALFGGMAGLATKGRTSANEATMHEIGKQLASSNLAIQQRAMNYVARTPAMLAALRNLSMTAVGQVAGGGLAIR